MEERDETFLYYIIWCASCQTAGVDALECCTKPKKEIGWFAATESKGTQG